MENLIKLKKMRDEVERLWRAIQSDTSDQTPLLHEEYRRAYESYKRQLAWVEAIGLSERISG